MISVIIPVYNEEKVIKECINFLIKEKDAEIIVVDGESTDNTLSIVRSFPIKIVSADKNRARQMNLGANAASCDVLLFLHADCKITPEGLKAIRESINSYYVGGCLSQKITEDELIYRCIESSGNLRAKLFKIFYGDQAIFVRKDVFFKVGGFDSVDLFDDVLFSKKLKQQGKTCRLNSKVYSSARRWQKQGIIKTTILNWIISLGFVLGVSPKTLKKVYADIR